MPQPLHLEGITLNGMHSFLTDSWVTVELTVTNPNAWSRSLNLSGRRCLSRRLGACGDSMSQKHCQPP
jgi:hypothetical protein